MALVVLGTAGFVAIKNGIPGLDKIINNSHSKNSIVDQRDDEDNEIDQQDTDVIDVTPPVEDTPEEEEPVLPVEPVEPEPTEINYTFPERMMAITLKAGEDFYTDQNVSDQDIMKSIDSAVKDSKDLSGNTIFVDLSYEDSVLFSGGVKKQVQSNVDMLRYLTESAKNNDIEVYVLFDVSDYYENTSPAECISNISHDIKAIANYDIDGILVDSYETNANGEMYNNYLEFGCGIGFDNYLNEISKKITGSIRNTAFQANPAVPVGITVEPIWANNTTNELGSDTQSEKESLIDGHSDTKQIVEEEPYDFVVVKCENSIGDKSAKFGVYTSWWDNIINDSKPMYIFQYATKACGDEKGWADPSELSDQVIKAEKLNSFEGSIFDSLSALKKNPKQSTDALIKYLTENVDPSFLLTQLEMTKPAKTTFSTYETVVVFAGASDINFDLLLNGEKVKRNQSGAFMLTLDLKTGLNTFTFSHKDKTIVYNITRNIQVLKEISPMGNLTANGGMSITVSALAYENSTVQATLGSSTVTLNPTTDVDDKTDNESTYKMYYGTISVPRATQEEQKLGNIVVKGKWENAPEEKIEGAYVTVAPKATSGSLIEVTADIAETFPVDTLNDLSDYDCYPLAKGCRDYTEGDEMTYVEGSETYTYYVLESGQRVYAKDVKVISGDIGNNEISKMTVESNKRYTYVTLEMSERVSYIAKYSQTAFTIDFKYTEKTPGDLNLECTPLFDSATWNGTKLTLKLSTTSGFLGYYAYYEGNNLVFRFNNPTGTYSLSGVPIVVDVGHSALGVGALGFLSDYGEYEINLAVCQKLKSELESMGATVYMMDTQNSRPSLADRTAYAFSKNPLLFISVHCNSSTTSTGHGSECFYFTRFSSDFSSRFASSVSSALETENRGSKISRYYVTRVHEYPSVLGEIGFVSNESDYYKLIQSSYQYAIAEGIANAAQNYLGSVGRSGMYNYGTQSTDGNSSYTEEIEEKPEDIEETVENPTDEIVEEN